MATGKLKMWLKTWNFEIPKLLRDILSKFDLWQVDILKDLVVNPAASMRLKRQLLDRIGEFSDHYEALGIYHSAEIPEFMAKNRSESRTLIDVLPVADYCVLKSLCEKVAAECNKKAQGQVPKLSIEGRKER